MARGILIILMLAVCVPAAAETEREAIAITIAAEACGEGARGMELVAMTIANRARAWQKTPYRVVTQPKQFYGYTASNRMRLYSQCRVTADQLADQLVSGNINDEIDGALYFRQPREPRYSWHKIETARYKNHIFYR